MKHSSSTQHLRAPIHLNYWIYVHVLKASSDSAFIYTLQKPTASASFWPLYALPYVHIMQTNCDGRSLLKITHTQGSSILGLYCQKKTCSLSIDMIILLLWATRKHVQILGTTLFFINVIIISYLNVKVKSLQCSRLVKLSTKSDALICYIAELYPN